MKYALIHCNVLDGTKEMSVQKDRTVIIEDSRIVRIQRGDVLSEDIDRIDLEGRYLLPGLINLHVHLPGRGKPRKSKGESRLAEMAEKYKVMKNGIQDSVKENILTQLYSGVTTLRSMGEIAHTDLHNRNQINKKQYIGPRVLVSGYGVTTPKGHMVGSMAIACSSSQESKALVEHEVGYGVDWIKLFVTGGILDARDEDEEAPLKISYEIAKAACDKAHKLGKKVASHAQSKEGVMISLRAGVDTVEHGSEMDEEIMSLYKKNQAAMIVTFSPAIPIAYLPIKMTKMTSKQQEMSKKLMEGMIKGAMQALEHDIPVGLGTDSACPYVTQYDMWREVYYFAKYCKVNNTFALHTATLKNAQILDMAHEIGSIEVGKCADLIVVEKNPLEDLRNLREVRMVITGGQVIKQPKIKHLRAIDKVLDRLL